MLLTKVVPITCRHVIARSMSEDSIIKEFDPKANIKRTDILSNDLSDPTKYRIPFLEEDEKRLWDSTVGDQWNLRPKFGLVKGLDRAHKQGLYPDVVPTPIKHFNFGGDKGLGERLRANIRAGSFGAKILGDMRKEKPDLGLVAYRKSQGRTTAHYVGKSLGPPVGKDGFADESFDSRIILAERRGEWFSSGLKYGFFTVAVVGNQNGLMGVAQAFKPDRWEAMFKARDEAYQQLHYFNRYKGYTVPYPLAGSYCRTECHVSPHMNFGKNVGNFYTKYMLDLAGYKGVSVKTSGRNTRQMICKALINTLLSYETHQEQADRLGRHVVRFHRMHGYRPEVLASPGSGTTTPVPITAEVAEVKGGPRPVKKGLNTISPNYAEH